jgi:hypothetical protein
MDGLPLPKLGDPLKKVILLLAALCCAVLVFNSLAQTTQPGDAGGFNVLKGYSDTNISTMNATFTTSPAIAVGQAVKFQPPRAGWKLQLILIMASDGWNSSVSSFPAPLPFTIEIRDKDLNLLYHYADTQLPYFTHPDLVTMADIEVPAMPMSGEFYVCFYGYGLIALMTELQNSTGNCYYYLMPTGQLVPAELKLKNNSTLPVNWIIRVAGQ